MTHWTLSVDNKRRLDRESKRRQRARLPRCAVKECEFVGRWLLKVRGKERRYCRNHFFLYVEHERIVERIRAIPDRTAI